MTTARSISRRPLAIRDGPESGSPPVAAAREREDRHDHRFAKPHAPIEPQDRAAACYMSMIAAPIGRAHPERFR
jgi:hypothetical protein